MATRNGRGGGEAPGGLGAGRGGGGAPGGFELESEDAEPDAEDTEDAERLEDAELDAEEAERLEDAELGLRMTLGRSRACYQIVRRCVCSPDASGNGIPGALGKTSRGNIGYRMDTVQNAWENIGYR